MLTCAWVTRHQPTRDQRRSLRDYKLIPVNPPRGKRFMTGEEAWSAVLRRCRGVPDLIVAVLPRGVWGKEFLCLAGDRAPGAPLLRAVMRQPELTEWSGVWLAFDHMSGEWYEWVPEEVR